jgi:hypothetical protein
MLTKLISQWGIPCLILGIQLHYHTSRLTRKSKTGGPGRHAVEYYYDDLFNILKHIYVRQLIPSASLEKL